LVAEVELIHIPEPLLVITRFDREIIDHGVKRLHIIDGCQALGLQAGSKYERPYGHTEHVKEIRDGASLSKLFDLVGQATPTPAAQRLDLLRWAIFQVLIGNTDAHAKNSSFFSTAAGLKLSPAYDLVSGTAFQNDNIDKTYAMAIGDAFSPDELSPYEWANFATACKLPLKLVGKELERMSNLVLKAIDEVLKEALSAGADSNHLALVARSIKTECQRQLAFAPEIRKVSPDLL
jgi:serine/threonine-protein kinase HipA